MRRLGFILLLICTLFFFLRQYAEGSNFTCSLVDENDDQITTASPGDIVYLVGSYIRTASGKITWSLTANMPSNDPKNSKMSMKYSGYYRHVGSSNVTSVSLPVLIPPFDYIVGTATFSGQLSKIGKCYGTLNIAQQEGTGIQIQSVTITSAAGPDFDVYSAPLACPADKPTGPETGLHREDAVISITAAKLNPAGGFNPFPASVEECTITYKKANEDPSAPVIESWTIYPNCALDGTGANNCPVSLIDITRKQQYWNDIKDGINKPAEYPTHYVAGYKCKYMNLVGKSGYFSVEYDLWLADFLMCG